jgi:hypothetical protein
MEDDCLKNETHCEFCETEFEKELEIDHLSFCLEFVVPCPNNCGVNEMKRKEVFLKFVITVFFLLQYLVNF